MGPEKLIGNEVIQLPEIAVMFSPVTKLRRHQKTSY